MNVEDGLAGLAFANQRQLLSTGVIGAVLNVSHEGEIRFASGLQFQNDSTVGVGVGSCRAGVATGNQQGRKDWHHANRVMQTHRIFPFSSRDVLHWSRFASSAPPPASAA